MKTELDNKLCADYPKIFKNRRAPMTETAMCWGFDCGDGWFNIIDKMCANIQSHINHTRQKRLRALRYNRALHWALKGDTRALLKYFTFGDSERSHAYAQERVDEILSEPEPQCKIVPEACPQVVAIQVKEKFGTLRFYYDGGDTKIDGMVRMAESMSGCTCEVCGSPGEIRGGSWLRCLCDAHA